jgi:drug/metabolite transporter (DMT)-like permease
VTGADAEGLRASRNFGYALIALAATGWGLWPLILKHAPMPAELSAAMMMLILTVASFPIMLRDRIEVRATAVDWIGIAWLGVADSANVGLFFAAYQRTTVAIAVLTHYLTPIFVALAAPLFLGERPRARTGVAVVVSFTGLVLLLEPWSADLSRTDLVGALLGAGSAVFYASNVLVNKRLAHVFSGSELMFFHGFIGVPLLWAFVPHGAFAAAPMQSLAIVAAASVGIGTICGLMFVWGLRRVVASHASILTLLEPFVAVVIAVLFMGQRMGLLAVVGGGLILVAALLVVTARPQRLELM